MRLRIGLCLIAILGLLLANGAGQVVAAPTAVGPSAMTPDLVDCQATLDLDASRRMRSV